MVCDTKEESWKTPMFFALSSGRRELPFLEMEKMASWSGGDLRSITHVESSRCLCGGVRWVARRTDLEYNEVVNAR